MSKSSISDREMPKTQWFTIVPLINFLILVGIGSLIALFVRGSNAEMWVKDQLPLIIIRGILSTILATILGIIGVKLYPLMRNIMVIDRDAIKELVEFDVLSIGFALLFSLIPGKPFAEHWVDRSKIFVVGGSMFLISFLFCSHSWR